MRDQKDFFLIERLEKPWLREYPSNSVCEIYTHPKVGLVRSRKWSKLNWTPELQVGWCWCSRWRKKHAEGGFGRSMEISVLANLSWKRQPEICEKVSKKQAKVLIWDRLKVERCLHLSVWARSGEEDLSMTCIKQGFGVSLSMKLLKSCGVKRRGDWVQRLATSSQTSRMNMGKLLHCFQRKKIPTDVKPPLTAHKDNWEEELRTLRETMISGFQGDRKIWDMEAPAGAGGSCHQWS